MTTLLESKTTHMMIDQAMLVPEDRDMASHWASDLMNNNPAYRWVVAKYVEADAPNSNRQQWTLSDLEERSSTVNHSPMNMLHRREHIVGNFIGQEILYPIAGNDTVEEAEQRNPYVEVVGAFWKYYFPNELASVERAFSEGSLFVSMECVGEHMTFIDPSGESKSFDYMGPSHESYGAWGLSKSNIRQIDQPHFLGGGLIIPPQKPGWKNATVKELSTMIDDNEIEAEMVYKSFAEKAPHLDSATWEDLMLVVMAKAKELS
jgi:hypothetical protein